MKKNIIMTILVCITAISMIIGILWHVTGTIHPGRKDDRASEASQGIEMLNEAESKSDIESVKDTEDNTQNTQDDSVSSGDLAGKKDAEEDLIDSMEVTMHLGDLTIITGSELGVSYTGDKKYEPEVQHTGSSLIIVQPEIKGWNSISQLFKTGSIKSKLTITLPEGTELSTCEIKEELGDIYIEELYVQTGSAANNLGDIECKECTLTNFSIESDLGDLNFDKCTFGILDIQEDLGDVDISSALDLTDATLELETDLGEVSINGEDQGNKHSRKGSDEIQLIVHNDLGDIDVTY